MPSSEAGTRGSAIQDRCGPSPEGTCVERPLAPEEAKCDVFLRNSRAQRGEDTVGSRDWAAQDVRQACRVLRAQED